MTSAETGLGVPSDLQLGAHPDREAWLESGRSAVDLLVQTSGRKDLSEVELLDVGCGTKVVKTLLDNSMPIGRYSGADVSARVIDWLRENVSDTRFEFHHLDAHNEMYNPAGRPLADFERLPVGPREFDLICLFSVFTHLAPHDFEAMLRVLRRHAKPDAKLLFSLFLNDPEHPSGYPAAIRAGLSSDDPEVRTSTTAALDQIICAGLSNDDPQVRAQTTAAIEKATRGRDPEGHPDDVEPFVDEIPGHPLMVARYREDLVRELFEGSGWEIESLHPPERYIQHYLVCKPV